MPWCVPRLAMACLGVCHGLSWHALGTACALVCATACHDMPMSNQTEVSSMPMGCNVLPRHALVCATACPWGAKASHARATACLGVCHAKAMRCQGKPWPATACLGVCHAQPMGCQGLPWHAHGQCQPRLVACPWHALVCATGCPWGAKASHGLPRAALVCATASPWVAKACHGMPWCVAWPAMGCHDMPWCVPRAAHGMPWCVPRQVMRVPN